MKTAGLTQEPVIEKIYHTGLVVGQSGRPHQLASAIDRKEGEFIFTIIKNDPTIRKTLEVGCGYGLSSLHICAALRCRKGVSHTIIDPYQYTPEPNGKSWDGAGIASLERAGFDFFHLLEMRSEFALPKLLEQGENQLDLIFIDGWHTFDHTLLDCFYATRLLRVGGVLILDNVWLPSVRDVARFLKNYPCYLEIGSVGVPIVPRVLGKIKRMLHFRSARPDGITQSGEAPKTGRVRSNAMRRLRDGGAGVRMVALRKIGEDRRSYNWHVAGKFW